MNILEKAKQARLQSELLGEYLAVRQAYSKPWKQEDLYIGQWDTINVFDWPAGRAVKEVFDACPEAVKLGAGFSRLYGRGIRTLGYSTLGPGSWIKEHVGDSPYRIHVPIYIPDGECVIRIGGVEHDWKEMEPLMFDDTMPHEAWNKTEDIRVIIIIDLLEDKMFPAAPDFPAINKQEKQDGEKTHE